MLVQQKSMAIRQVDRHALLGITEGEAGYVSLRLSPTIFELDFTLVDLLFGLGLFQANVEDFVTLRVGLGVGLTGVLEALLKLVVAHFDLFVGLCI